VVGASLRPEASAGSQSVARRRVHLDYEIVVGLSAPAKTWVPADQRDFLLSGCSQVELRLEHSFTSGIEWLLQLDQEHALTIICRSRLQGDLPTVEPGIAGRGMPWGRQRQPEERTNRVIPEADYLKTLDTQLLPVARNPALYLVPGLR